MDQTSPRDYFLPFTTIMARDVSTQLTRNEAVLHTRIFSSERLLTPRPQVASGVPLALNIKWMGLFSAGFLITFFMSSSFTSALTVR